MKASEFLIEDYDYSEQITIEARNIMIAAKAAGITTVDMQQFIDHLNQSGYSVSEENAAELLKDIPFVSLNGDEINVTGEDGEATTFDNDPEHNKEIVSNLAQKAAKRGVS